MAATDYLLTFADKEKPAQGGLGLVVGAKASADMKKMQEQGGGGQKKSR